MVGYHSFIFRFMPRLCPIPGPGGIAMENLIGGIIALLLIIYLFFVLLRPEKF
jgi:K+-transporting ATPase KdpF subunit